jgi:hypothetical protein
MYDDGMPPPDWYSDTDPRALRAWIEIQRRMDPAQKAQAVFQLSEDLMRAQEAAVRRAYPQAAEREIFLRTLARRLDRSLMVRVYGWAPAGCSR